MSNKGLKPNWTGALLIWRGWFLVSVAIALYASYCTDYHRG